MGCCASLYQFDGDLQREFDFLSKIAQGSQSTVWRCRDLSNGELVAIKLFPRGFGEKLRRNLLLEVELQCQLRHPNLLLPVEVFVDSSYFGIVLPYLAGGDLLTYSKRHPVTEDYARYFMIQLLSAVKYCHDSHVAHRDVKLENIFVNSRDPPVLKLADFGVAKAWKRSRNRRMHTLAGTPGYFAPQVLESVFLPEHAAYDGVKADIWSCGIVLAFMMLRRNPYSKSWQEAYSPLEQLRGQWVSEIGQPWSEDKRIKGQVAHLSPELQDMLDHLLDPSEETRITAEQALQHPWFTKTPLPTRLQNALDRMVVETSKPNKRAEPTNKGLEESEVAPSLDAMLQLASLRDMPLPKPFLRLRTEDMSFSHTLVSQLSLDSSSSGFTADMLQTPHQRLTATCNSSSPPGDQLV